MLHPIFSPSLPLVAPCRLDVAAQAVKRCRRRLFDMSLSVYLYIRIYWYMDSLKLVYLAGANVKKRRTFLVLRWFIPLWVTLHHLINFSYMFMKKVFLITALAVSNSIFIGCANDPELSVGETVRKL